VTDLLSILSGTTTLASERYTRYFHCTITFHLILESPYVSASAVPGINDRVAVRTSKATSSVAVSLHMISVNKIIIKL
jgi:hypothetical protein